MLQRAARELPACLEVSPLASTAHQHIVTHPFLSLPTAGDGSTSEQEIQALATSLFGGPSDVPPTPADLACPLPPELELQGLLELNVVCGSLTQGVLSLSAMLCTHRFML